MAITNKNVIKTKHDYCNSKYLKKFAQKKVKTYERENLFKTVDKTSFKLQVNDGVANQSIYVPNGVWLTGAVMLWTQGYTGNGCTVGLIDSGIDPLCEDIQNVKKRMSFIGDEDYTSLNFHGTHVAGTIGANGFLKGVAPNVKLNDYRVFDETGNTKAGVVEKAIIQAADDECQVINLSLGGPYPTQLLKSAVKYAVKKGSLLVVAAGNEGSQLEWGDIAVSYPANYKNVLSVSSINFSMKTGKITFSDTKFSNRNPEVDVCADGYKVLSNVLNNRYAVISGTSMACPHASGFASLLWEKANLVTKNTNHSVCDLYTIVKTSTVPIDVNDFDQDPKILGNITGAGLVTAFPEVPTRRENGGEFYLPNVNLLSPQLDIEE